MAARNPLTSTPQRVAFAGDWHGDSSWARRAIWAAQSRQVDVILHLGDFGYQFRPYFLQLLTDALTVAGIPLLFVDGNHDDHRWLAGQPVGRHRLRQLTDWIWHIPRGTRWRWHGLKWCGLGGAHSVDGMWRRRGGLMWQPEERISDAQAELVKRGGWCDVLLAHDCPDGVDIPGLHPEDFPPLEILRAEEHRALLREVVDAVQPRAIWHGHYHVRYTRTPDFGYGPVKVTGLAANDGTMSDNLQVVDLDDLARGLKERRGGR